MVTDSGPQMTSKGFLEYLRKSGHFKHIRISYRHPTSIGLIERFHRTLKVEDVWVKGYRDPIEARRSIARFIKEYNCPKTTPKPEVCYTIGSLKGRATRRGTTGGEKAEISGPNYFSF